MIDPTISQLHNARSVIQSWAKGAHLMSWDSPAHDERPSVLFTHCAKAFSALQQTADEQAEILRRLGFQPSHPEVTELRRLASTSARRATQHLQWAETLAQAEQEIGYGPHDDE